MRRTILIGVLASFIVELAIAEVVLRTARDSSVAALLTPQPDLGTALLAGAGLGVLIALATRVFFGTVAWQITRQLFLPLFQRATNGEMVLLSLLPGLGEEVLFRGVLQPHLGLAATSLVFGLLHSGFSRFLLPYGLWATLVGALLGTLYLWTGDLWASVAAHGIVNASGILWARSLAEPGAPAAEE